MTNVLHLINYLGSGGTEKYILSLAEKLHNKSCRFYTAYSEEGSGRKLFEKAGVELFRLRMRNPADIHAAMQLKALCAKLSVDVIHTHFLRENYIAILSKILGNRVKIINTRHMLFENSKSVILTNRLLTGFNDSIIAVSGKVREQLLREGISPDKIKLIYNGVDPQEWSSPCTATFRRKHGISEDEIVITSVARFSPEKGHDFYLDAIRHFKDVIAGRDVTYGSGASQMKFRFVLAGDGELLNPMKEKAKRLGLSEDTLFPGYVPDVRDLLKSSDLFVSHSSCEALGISILEAMAAGLPVISTDSGGTREIINGIPETGIEAGILIEYGDKSAMADSLIRLIESRELREKYINNGWRIIREQFNLDKTSQETYNLYRQ